MDQERKLSAIFASDVVGFSKMMAVNEQLTLEILNERRKIIDSLILDHRGRIFGSAGDSVLAEFSSPIRATECAVKIQEQMESLNSAAATPEKMVFRIGINVGDVMVTEENLFGDAVNVAARLESAANPAGICVSKSVFDLINRKLMVAFEDAGALELKNIAQPIQAYFVTPGGSNRFLEHDEKLAEKKIESAAPGSIAVMLFRNLSKDEEQGYICEGFSEDLVSSLSKYSKLLVLAGNASFSYHDKSSSPNQVGRELGVRYILEGSIRKLGSKIRISSKLIGTDKEHTIWSNNFDTTIDDLFDVHDDIVETIVTTIVGRVEDDEVKKLANSRPDNMTAYDLVLQGLEYYREAGFIKENTKKAFQFFNKAVDVDPNYARAHAWRACSMPSYFQQYPETLSDQPDYNWQLDCISSAEKAVKLDENDHEAHRIMGSIALMKNDYVKARFHSERSMELCPSDAFILGLNAKLMVLVSDLEAGFKTVERAKRIHPFCPDNLLLTEALCFYWKKDYESAVNCFTKLRNPTNSSRFYLSATYIKMGDAEKAKEIIAPSQSLNKDQIEKFVSGEQYENTNLKKDLQDTLMVLLS